MTSPLEQHTPLNTRQTREEEAERSLKRTHISRGMALTLTIFFIFALSFEIVVQTSVELSRNMAARRVAAEEGAPLPSLLPQYFDVFKLLPSWQAIREARGFWGYWALQPPAESISLYETELKNQSVMVEWLLPHTQVPLTGWLGAGNEKAYCGRDGWLYYRPDIDYLTGPGFLEPMQMRKRKRGDTPIQPDPLKAILLMKEDLEKRGIELIILPAPTKAMIDPQMLNKAYEGHSTPLQNRSFPQFVQALRSEGVHVIDIAPLLVQERVKTGQAQFLATDTHWTPQAMELSAQALANYINEHKLLPAQPASGYVQRKAQITGMGDLVTMLKLPSGQRIFSPQRVTTQQIFDAEGAPWRIQRDADVLLLGDSFVNIYSLSGMGWGEQAGFCEQLSYALQRPLDAIVRNAGGSFATRVQLQSELRRGRDRLAGKRLVIYQFAMRDLSEGDWKMLPLPPVKQQQTPAITAAFTLTGIDPEQIDPTKQQQTVISFSANVAAHYRVLLHDAASVMRQQLAEGEAAANDAITVNWNGIDTAGASYPPGAYTVTIEGNTATGMAIPSVSSPLTITGEVAALQLLLTSVTPTTIDPTAGEKTTFTINVPSAGSYRVSILSSAQSVVATPVGRKEVTAAGNPKESWNGKDRRGTALADGTYTIKVEGADRDGVAFTPATASIILKRKVTTPVEKGLVVQGRIQSISKSPAPGSVPYKDCIIAIELSVNKVVAGELDARNILVYLWGMRDNTLKNDRLTAGQTVTLRLTPWDQAEGQYGGYNRVEPDNDDALFLDAYWGEVR